jgi:hypothetical protein
MKILLLFIFTGFSLSTLFSQLTIDKDDFYHGSGSTGISTSTDFSIDYASTGADHSWDFSSLTENSQTFEFAYDISNGGQIINFQFGSFAAPEYQATYYQPYGGLPIDQIGNFLPVNIESVNRMVKVDSSQVTFPGYSLEIDGNQIGFKSDTIEKGYDLILQYGDTDSSRAYTNFDLNPFADAQLIQYRQRKSEVDGFGNLITPYGNYDALRIHHAITEQDSLRIVVFGSNQWIPINRTINHYEWWDKNSNRPVLRVSTQEIGGNENPTDITYFNNTVLQTAKEDFVFSIYPNPVHQKLIIKSDTEIKHLTLYDMAGKKVYANSPSSMKVIVDVSDLRKGSYTIRIQTKKGEHVSPIVIE